MDNPNPTVTRMSFVKLHRSQRNPKEMNLGKGQVGSRGVDKGRSGFKEKLCLGNRQSALYTWMNMSKTY